MRNKTNDSGERYAIPILPPSSINCHLNSLDERLHHCGRLKTIKLYAFGPTILLAGPIAFGDNEKKEGQAVQFSLSPLRYSLIEFSSCQPFFRNIPALYRKPDISSGLLYLHAHIRSAYIAIRLVRVMRTPCRL